MSDSDYVNQVIEKMIEFGATPEQIEFGKQMMAELGDAKHMFQQKSLPQDTSLDFLQAQTLWTNARDMDATVPQWDELDEGMKNQIYRIVRATNYMSEQTIKDMVDAVEMFKMPNK